MSDLHNIAIQILQIVKENQKQQIESDSRMETILERIQNDIKNIEQRTLRQEQDIEQIKSKLLDHTKYFNYVWIALFFSFVFIFWILSK